MLLGVQGRDACGSHGSAQPHPARPRLQTEFCLVQKRSELPWPESGSFQQGRGDLYCAASLRSPSCLSGQGLPPPPAFLTRMKLIGSL